MKTMMLVLLTAFFSMNAHAVGIKRCDIPDSQSLLYSDDTIELATVQGSEAEVLFRSLKVEAKSVTPDPALGLMTTADITVKATPMTAMGKATCTQTIPASFGNQAALADCAIFTCEIVTPIKK